MTKTATPRNAAARRRASKTESAPEAPRVTKHRKHPVSTAA